MESNLNQTQQEKEVRPKFKERYPFLNYLKGRLVDYLDPDTGRRYTGHVAMYYRDSGRIRIDWDNGATTYHDFKIDSKWIFKVVKRTEKIDGEGEDDNENNNA